MLSGSLSALNKILELLESPEVRPRIMGGKHVPYVRRLLQTTYPNKWKRKRKAVPRTKEPKKSLFRRAVSAVWQELEPTGEAIEMGSRKLYWNEINGKYERIPPAILDQMRKANHASKNVRKFNKKPYGVRNNVNANELNLVAMKDHGKAAQLLNGAGFTKAAKRHERLHDHHSKFYEKSHARLLKPKLAMKVASVLKRVVVD